MLPWSTRFGPWSTRTPDFIDEKFPRALQQGEVVVGGGTECFTGRAVLFDGRPEALARRVAVGLVRRITDGRVGIDEVEAAPRPSLQLPHLPPSP